MQKDEGILADIISAHRAEDHNWYLLPLFLKKHFYFYAVYQESQSVQNVSLQNQSEMCISSK